MGCWWRRLGSAPVGLLEQTELRAGVRVFAADDDPHPGRPAGQVEQGGDLDDITPVTDGAIGVDRRRPRSRRHLADRGADLVGDREPDRYSTLRPRFASRAVSQSNSPCEAPAPSARTSSFFRWTAGTCAIAAVSTATWSAVVFEPAFPGRSIAASISWVLMPYGCQAANGCESVDGAGAAVAWGGAVIRTKTSRAT
jgi:hypothetical protein